MGESDSLRKGLENLEPFMGIYEDFMDTYDAPRKVIGSDLEEKDFED